MRHLVSLLLAGAVASGCMSGIGHADVDALKQVKADLARFYDEAAPRS